MFNQCYTGMRKMLIILMLTAVAFAGYAQQPTFKGGQQALDNFLSQKIVYPEYAKQNCISGTIKVGFVVDENGKVINPRVIQGFGIDLDDEALRVVKLTSGKWVIPINYQPLNIVLPIRFEADQTVCGISNNDMNLAIANYKSQQSLEDVVTNYYKAKYLSKADTTHEAAIISLKKQLGYDDKFIDDVLEQAHEKLNQGDNEGACHDWTFIRNIGSNRADDLLAKYCK
jgi:TonB family protein